MPSPFERLQRTYMRVFDTDFVRRIVRNSGYLVSSTVVVAGIGLVQGSLQLQVLGLAGLGLLGAVSGFTNLINRFTSFRIDEMVVRYVRLYQERKEHDKAAAVYKMAALLEMAGAFAAFFLIAVLAPLGVQLFSDQSGTERWFILYGTLVLVNVIFDSSDGILQVFDRFDAKAVIDVIQSVVRLGATAFVFFEGGGLYEIILAELAGRAVRSVGIIGLAIYSAGRAWGRGWWRTPLGVLRKERRSLLTFAFSTNLSATVSLVAKDSEGLWANAFLGNVGAGIYGLARTLIGFLQIPVSPLPATTYPELSRAVAQDDWPLVNGLLKRGSFLASVYSLPVAAGLIVFGRQIISIYSGGNEAALAAYTPLVILALGYTFVNIFYWNRAALLAFNRPVYPTLVNFIGMLLKVGGIFLWGAVGAAAFAALLSGYYVFTVGIAVLRVRRDVSDHLKPAQTAA